MLEMNVYIANLGKYVEGELVGAWFTPPIDYEDVKTKIGLNEEYEEIAIHDYESPIPIPEYISIDELNHIAELLEELSDGPFGNIIGDMIGYWFRDLDELIDQKENLIFYQGCHTMEDIAYTFVEEGYFGEIPEHMQMYLDYSAIARDLEINGNFLITNYGVVEYIG
jgi:antirestriction protein